eukprot:TRINITY_DN42245_c0_g1_i1.p1 TRINITY_DN42245_c0_g1~~TRINITY_DN42245_c0_g1_i1.p1  ORF type:complete len:225 (+),score=23.47 TRINITY_DN42245_c0_g1_i1:44-718(+)
MLWGAWRGLQSVAKKYTFATGVAIATIKTGSADYCTQRYIEHRSMAQVDIPRLACFTLLGFTTAGCFQQFLYVNVFARCFPNAASFTKLPTIRTRLQDKAGLRDLVLQTAAVNFLWLPVFFHLFYVFQEFVQGVSAKASSDIGVGGVTGALARAHAGWDRCRENCGEALDRCRRNLRNDLAFAWSMWIPGHLVTFAVPLWMRMPLTHSLSFLYFSGLSCMRGHR